MRTLFDKIWDKHVVQQVPDGPTQLYIDRLYCHEVTSPQAFDGMRARGLKCFRPDHVFCMPDHNTPTHDQDKPIADPVSRNQVETLARNAAEFGLTHFGMMDPDNGIIHVVGPEKGLSLPGMTIVCGDSHTSTHGAMGAVAFGIGTSEVEMVLASQCVLQQKPKSMRITINGTLGRGVTAKDVALYLMVQLTTSGATGYFVEYAGDVVRNLSMEGRLTLCNLSIEMGARGGFIAPDQVTFDYLRGRDYAPKGEAWDQAVAYWQTLRSDDDAVFDRELSFDAADIEPRITYGTNPGMGIGITERIPKASPSPSKGGDVQKPVATTSACMCNQTPPPSEGLGEAKALSYMGFQPGQKLLGTKVDYVFLGACTNGRVEDFRAFASIVKGRRKADDVTAWLVPGSWAVYRQLCQEGLDKLLREAGFEIRQPGCSACLAMNDDKVPAGKLCVSTSNRNFEGRQGPGARTILASPLTAAAAAVTGVITDPRTLL
jgi:3-isopropylmalate/(R)-2-methylmalate dehydratase large subunit